MQDVNDEFFSHHFSKRRENSEMINSREYVNLMPCDKCAEFCLLVAWLPTIHLFLPRNQTK